MGRFAAAIACILAAACGGPAAAEGTLRILSYNIHHGRGTDGVVDLERIATVIRGCDADVALLQEVDDQTVRTGHVDQPAELARLTGLHVEFGRQIDYQGGRYGQAILSRTPLLAPQVHVLPGDPDRETRIAFSARTTAAGRELVVVGTHLHHLDPAARLEQARAIVALDLGTGPAVLGGDLNALPESDPVRELLATWSSTGAGPLPTFPAGAPVRQLDYVLHRPAGVLEAVECRVLDEPVASDHRPVLAVFRVR
ncbi:MAG: endonuclease/exonuclease/phosphatase family protein [Planctomycetota bacterium]